MVGHVRNSYAVVLSGVAFKSRPAFLDRNSGSRLGCFYVDEVRYWRGKRLIAAATSYFSILNAAPERGRANPHIAILN